MALTNKKVSFSLFESKTDFTSALQSELTNNIVFIQDTKEVYTHGTFWGIRDVTLNYDSATTSLQLKDGNAVITEVDATPFVKDGMLDSVTLVTVAEQGVTVEVPYLKFVFNTVKTSASGASTPSHEVIRVSVKDLVDIYDGSGIALSQNYTKAASYSDPAAGDTLDEAIGLLSKGMEDTMTQLVWNEY
jgi:hypothetical protein